MASPSSSATLVEASTTAPLSYSETETDLESKVTTEEHLDTKAEAATNIDSEATVADPAATIKNVYQFKIALKRIKPKIWRRIQVPEDYSFWDFHVAIQDVMGWNGYHLHQFEMKNPKTGGTDIIGKPYGPEGIGLDPIIHEEKALISEYFTSSNNKADYDYDLGDTWNHEILFEKILPVAARTKYPRCISGKRATPLEEVCDSNDEFEVRSDDFNPKTVTFSDPAKRMKL